MKFWKRRQMKNKGNLLWSEKQRNRVCKRSLWAPVMDQKLWDEALGKHTLLGKPQSEISLCNNVWENWLCQSAMKQQDDVCEPFRTQNSDLNCPLFSSRVQGEFSWSNEDRGILTNPLLIAMAQVLARQPMFSDSKCSQALKALKWGTMWQYTADQRWVVLALVPKPRRIKLWQKQVLDSPRK